MGSKKWDEYLAEIAIKPVQLGQVPPEYEHRPDLISDVWFGSTGLWWQVLVMNGLFDPFEDLDRGSQILLPDS